MDSDSSVSPLLSLACRFLPHDQWFTTHVDPDWKVKQVKSWLLAKCLPYAAPPSPPLRQSARKPQRPPSPITFAPDPRHRPISPITFAMPKQKVATDDASEFEEPPITDISEPEPQPSPEEILPPIQPPKKRAILPTASTSAKGDLYSQYTLIRFSTGQLLEDDLPLSFYDMQANELLELHRVGIIVTLPRAHPTRYLDAYWEGRVRVLRMKPLDDEEDSYPLYKVRQLETRALEWRERWLVVREGSIYLCRDETRLIHTLLLADLVQLTNTGVPPSATPSSKTRVLLARFSPASSSLVSTRASSPINPFGSDSSSDLSSPIFAHDSSDSNRPRRKLHRRVRKRADPEYLILDLKDDAAYVSLLRVLHRHALPRSTFVDKLPVGTAELLEYSPRSALPDDEDADDDAPPPLRHPPSLAHLHIPPRGLSLGALPFPEWRTNVLQRARQAGLGRIGKAVEWVLWNGETAEDPAWMLDSISPVRSRRRRRRRRQSPVKQPTSSDGYDSDLSGDASPSLSEMNAEDDSDSDTSSSSRRGAGARSETEWVGWMGDLRRQTRVAKEERARAAAREEARRLAEETRDAELGLPPLPPGSGAEVTISRVGTGVDDRQRRAALEPSATVTSLSGVNPPSHSLSQAHLGLLPHGTSSASSGTYSGSPSVVSAHATPVLSSPSSTESFGFAFSPLAPPMELADPEDTSAPTSWMQLPHFTQTHSRAHSRTHSHTLLHSVSMHDVHPHPHPLMTANFPPSHGAAGPVAATLDPFARRPSMPAMSAARWGDAGAGTSGSRPSSSSERGGEATVTVASGGSSTGITEVPRAPATVGRSGSVSGGKGLLRKKNEQKEREKEQQLSELSDWRKGKEKDKEKSPPNTLSRRPRLSVSTTDPKGLPRMPSQQTFSPPQTPLTEQVADPAVPVKKKKRGLARGVSIRAERFVKSLDSALDFVDGR
ncbi:hypothetical protein MSAN_00660500 [Mycena sanguinolenta]|uniref:Uncharacterized protein n=1 Tax=Mycena sanguinolenta TaxID=230812 RepID=A0A8H6Z3R5_9AGAR|nr:hypothetical protein MSAN_00660500 [Mycena sanguinolenta]